MKFIPEPLSKSRVFLLAAFVLTALIAAIYGQTAYFDFINFDDNRFVNNFYIARGLTADTIRWALGANLFYFSSHVEYWSPLTLMSRLFDATVSGMDPGWMHVSSMMWHIGNTMILFALLILATKSPRRAFAVAALFAVHPMHVEPVVWLSARKDLVSTFFYFATLLAYVYYAQRPNWRRYAGVLLAAVAAFMSKPMAVTLPIVMLILDFWPLKRLEMASLREFVASFLRRALEKAPFFAMSLLGAWVALYSQSQWRAIQSTESLPILDRLQNALMGYWDYIRLTFWPANLSILYPIQPPPAAWVVALVLLGALAWLWLAFRVREQKGFLLFGTLWFAVVLLPVIGLVQVSQQSIADRYSYLSHVGLFVILVWGIADFAAAQKREIRLAVWGAGAAVVISFAVAAFLQASKWKNSLTLFQHVVSVDPRNDAGWLLLGGELARRGDLPAARVAFVRTVEINPRQSQAYTKLAGVAFIENKVPEAQYWVEGALKIDPGDPGASGMKGEILSYLGDLQGAGAAYKKALDAQPDDPYWLEKLAEILDKSGDRERARKIREKAQKLRGDS